MVRPGLEALQDRRVDAGVDALNVGVDWGTGDSERTDAAERLLPRLMSFLLGGLRAPLPQFAAAGDSAAARAA